MSAKRNVLDVVRGDEDWLSDGEIELVKILKEEVSAEDLGVTKDAIRHRAERLLEKHQRLFNPVVRVSDVKRIVEEEIKSIREELVHLQSQRTGPREPGEDVIITTERKNKKPKHAKWAEEVQVLEVRAIIRSRAFVLDLYEGKSGKSLHASYSINGLTNYFVSFDFHLEDPIAGKTDEELYKSKVDFFNIKTHLRERNGIRPYFGHTLGRSLYVALIYLNHVIRNVESELDDEILKNIRENRF